MCTTFLQDVYILTGLARPQPGRLDDYKDVLERVNAGLVFGSIERDSRDTARLVETGAKKLSQLYTKLVAEASSSVPANGVDFQLSPLPTSQLTVLIPLVQFLRTLPLPATHPSHPAAPAIQASLKEAQKGYADMRGAWGKKCLELYARRVVERSETLDGVKAGREFGVWVNNVLTVAEVRHTILQDTSFLTPIHVVRVQSPARTCPSLHRLRARIFLRYAHLTTRHALHDHAHLHQLSD